MPQERFAQSNVSCPGSSGLSTLPLFPRHKTKGIGFPVSPRSRSRHRIHRTYKVEDTPQVFIEIDVLWMAGQDGRRRPLCARILFPPRVPVPRWALATADGIESGDTFELEE